MILKFKLQDLSAWKYVDRIQRLNAIRSNVLPTLDYATIVGVRKEENAPEPAPDSKRDGIMLDCKFNDDTEKCYYTEFPVYLMNDEGKTIENLF